MVCLGMDNETRKGFEERLVEALKNLADYTAILKEAGPPPYALYSATEARAYMARTNRVEAFESARALRHVLALDDAIKAFNKNYDWFVTQLKPRSTVKSKHGTGGCEYYASDGSGRRCGVGVLLPDIPPVTLRGASYIGNQDKAFFDEMGWDQRKDMAFLKDLQAAHDLQLKHAHARITRYSVYFKLALKWGLECPPLEDSDA